MVNCSNCTATLPDGAAFCPACGQSVKSIDRPWREALGDILRELFDFEGRMMVSLRLLMTRPGFLSFEYMHGRRIAYTSPLRMYLVISLVFFVVLPMIRPEYVVTSESHEFSADRYSQAMFLLLPLFALLMKIFYRPIYYLAHLVFTLHLFSAMFIVFAVMLSLESMADRYMALALLQVLLLLYMLIYAVVALGVAYRDTWIKTALKFLGLFVIFLPVIVGVIELASHISSIQGPG